MKSPEIQRIQSETPQAVKDYVDNKVNMRREIKFRAWDEENKVMIPWSDDFFYDTSPVTQFTGDFSSIEMPLMQYTGLKDKGGKGKEVYESDIVEWNGRIGKVVFYKGSYWLANLDHKGNGMPKSSGWLNEDCVIIGNEFENPELLTDKT